jgi:hypothetical protein
VARPIARLDERPRIAVQAGIVAIQQDFGWHARRYSDGRDDTCGRVQNLGWCSDGKKLSSNRQEDTAKDGRKRKTLSVRQVPQAQPETGNDSRPVVLPELFES